MTVTDPIADMATLIRNASSAGKEKADVRFSKINSEILEILKRENFIENFKRSDDKIQGFLRVYLKYDKDKRPSITKIKRVSKPGLRVYRNKKGILPVLGGLGITIVSTSRGIVTDKEARENNLGGEVLLKVW